MTHPEQLRSTRQLRDLACWCEAVISIATSAQKGTPPFFLLLLWSTLILLVLLARLCGGYSDAFITIMGSCFSTPEEGESAQTKRARGQQQTEDLVLPEAKWQLNESWTERVTYLRKSAADEGKAAEFLELYPVIFFKLVRDWLAEANPACARAGSIEDMGESDIGTREGPSRHPARSILTLDEHFTGVVYSITVALALPPQEDGKGAIVPGSTINTPELEGVKQNILTSVALMAQSNTGVNIKHAILNVFVGTDLFTWKWDAQNKEPTIKKHNRQPNESFLAMNKKMAEAARKAPELFPGKFRFTLFETSIERRKVQFPGSTIWDEGELPFMVDGKAYPFPTRLLVSREIDSTAQDLDNAAHFKIINAETGPTNETHILSRSSNPAKDPGRIVAVTLVVAGEPDELWPLFGAYANSAALKAAEAALLEHVKKLNRQGRVQRCLACVNMGFDESEYIFVGEDFSKAPLDEQAQDATAPKAQDTSLGAFSIELQEQPKHELFQSEAQFQAIKQHMQQRFQEDPARFEALAPQIAIASASRWLETNFPECEFSDEGDFPSEEIKAKLPGTKLLVARDPKQEPRGVVAAIHVVPRMPSETSWLGTPEMKEAEDSLLALLKTWHAESKTSEVDCMAQVMMGTDVSLYQFADGEKFVDYSDERMAQIKWG